jgi:hypothetical protein
MDPKYLKDYKNFSVHGLFEAQSFVSLVDVGRVW